MKRVFVPIDCMGTFCVQAIYLGMRVVVSGNNGDGINPSLLQSLSFVRDGLLAINPCYMCWVTMKGWDCFLSVVIWGT